MEILAKGRRGNEEIIDELGVEGASTLSTSQHQSGEAEQPNYRANRSRHDVSSLWSDLLASGSELAKAEGVRPFAIYQDLTMPLK